MNKILMTGFILNLISGVLLIISNVLRMKGL